MKPRLETSSGNSPTSSSCISLKRSFPKVGWRYSNARPRRPEDRPAFFRAAHPRLEKTTGAA
jgi:hypothetical protein